MDAQKRSNSLLVTGLERVSFSLIEQALCRLRIRSFQIEAHQLQEGRPGIESEIDLDRVRESAAIESASGTAFFGFKGLARLKMNTDLQKDGLVWV